MIFATNATTYYIAVRVSSTWPWYGELIGDLIVDTVVGVRTLASPASRSQPVDALDPGQRKARRGARRHKYRQVARLSERRRPDLILSTGAGKRPPVRRIPRWVACVASPKQVRTLHVSVSRAFGLGVRNRTLPRK